MQTGIPKLFVERNVSLAAPAINTTDVYRTNIISLIVDF
jgi:hypothetical protein